MISSHENLCARALIDNAPDDNGELVQWLDSLDHSQFERVWCGVIAERLADVSVKSAMEMLTYVRERYRLAGFRHKKVEIDERELRRLYLDEKMSMVQIQKRLGRSDSTIHNHLRRMGINRPLRVALKFRKQRRGEVS